MSPQIFKRADIFRLKKLPAVLPIILQVLEIRIFREKSRKILAKRQIFFSKHRISAKRVKTARDCKIIERTSANLRSAEISQKFKI